MSKSWHYVQFTIWISMWRTPARFMFMARLTLAYISGLINLDTTMWTRPRPVPISVFLPDARGHSILQHFLLSVDDLRHWTSHTCPAARTAHSTRLVQWRSFVADAISPIPFWRGCQIRRDELHHLTDVTLYIVLTIPQPFITMHTFPCIISDVTQATHLITVLLFHLQISTSNSLYVRVVWWYVYIEQNNTWYDGPHASSNVVSEIGRGAPRCRFRSP